jgi:hypothetical protein
MRWLVLLIVACSSAPKPPPPPTVATAPPPKPAPVDSDGDGIVDIDDRCPNDPETVNGSEDTDGCPDRGCVVINQFPMCIEERVFFERGKGVPTTALYGPILDNMAEAMKSAPDIEQVELRGFRSGDEPRTLSRQRAASVQALLVQRGIDASRFALVDAGVGAPADAANGQRRVELAITKQRVAAADAEIILCTPMGRYFKRMTDEERRASCH